MTIRARFEDRRGRTVELTAERWGHIAERHSDIRALGDAVVRAVQRPDYWTLGRNANEEWFYLKTDAGRWAAEEPAGAPEPASGVGVLGHSGHRAI